MNNFTNLFIYICFIHYVFTKRYDNYTLFRVIIRSDEDVEFVRNLSKKYEVNFWTQPTTRLKEVDFSVAPSHKHLLKSDTLKAGLTIFPVHENIQSLFDQQTVKTYSRRKLNTFNWDNYYRLNDIYAWMRDLATENPSDIEVFNIGYTYQLREILAMRINYGGLKNKSKVIFEGTMHAREWISVSVVTYIINQVLNAKLGDVEYLTKNIAHTYEWLFVPVSNPDGYEYTHTKDRLWRRNLHGHGIDLNRNFDAAFYRNEELGNPTDETYPGTAPLSELETMALAKLVQNNRNNLLHYYALHSYGQFFIIPYAFTKEHLDNYDEMANISITAITKLQSLYNTRFTYGNAYETVGYLAFGTSMCWVKKTFRVPYVATIELRDDGEFGFALPPTLITPTAKETLLGIASMLNNSNQPITPLEEYTHHYLESGAQNIGFRFLNKDIPLFMVIIQVIN